MTTETRRASVHFAFSEAAGAVTETGDGEALILDDKLTVGPLTVAFLDADAFRAADYRIELDLWPNGRLTLTQLGRRFDTFGRELGRARNQTRVAGLLAHGLTMPEVFSGGLVGTKTFQPADFQLYDTHLTVVPETEDPWQVPLGTVTAVRVQDDPPGVVLTSDGATLVIGQLGRRRDACYQAIIERYDAQRRLLAELTGQRLFADGRGVPYDLIQNGEHLLRQFTAADRQENVKVLRAAATNQPRFGFVQLLDPDGDASASSNASLPEHWASFLLVPVGPIAILEILCGPAAATYVFRAGIESVNRDLQLLHFRRAPLALTPDEATLTPQNRYRLALRKLDALQRLRACTSARLIHNEGWSNSLRTALKQEQPHVSV